MQDPFGNKKSDKIFYHLKLNGKNKNSEPRDELIRYVYYEKIALFYENRISLIISKFVILILNLSNLSIK